MGLFWGRRKGIQSVLSNAINLLSGVKNSCQAHKSWGVDVLTSDETHPWEHHPWGAWFFPTSSPGLCQAASSVPSSDFKLTQLSLGGLFWPTCQLLPHPLRSPIPALPTLNPYFLNPLPSTESIRGGAWAFLWTLAKARLEMNCLSSGSGQGHFPFMQRDTSTLWRVS